MVGIITLKFIADEQRSDEFLKNTLPMNRGLMTFQKFIAAELRSNEFLKN